MDACSLCCDESHSWAVGPCEHATCLVCSVRLRVLCDQRDCPVCREKLNKVRVASVSTWQSLLCRAVRRPFCCLAPCRLLSNTSIAAAITVNSVAIDVCKTLVSPGGSL